VTGLSESPAWWHALPLCYHLSDHVHIRPVELIQFLLSTSLDLTIAAFYQCFLLLPIPKKSWKFSNRILVHFSVALYCLLFVTTACEFPLHWCVLCDCAINMLFIMSVLVVPRKLMWVRIFCGCETSTDGKW
jgi:hypothetical protein